MHSEIIQGEYSFINERSLPYMGRGKEFNHKRKGHPGNLPEDTLVERKSRDAIGDEEFIVVQEAFKNRVEETDIE
jgi:hypothetical protein